MTFSPHGKTENNERGLAVGYSTVFLFIYFHFGGAA
jgi:hypothetical protein